MMNKNADHIDKREYQTPVLFEYGDIASVTQNEGGFGEDALGQSGSAV